MQYTAIFRGKMKISWIFFFAQNIHREYPQCTMYALGPPIWKISWYQYLIVCLVFSHLGFWSGNLFLNAPFPDLCLLVPFWVKNKKIKYTPANPSFLYIRGIKGGIFHVHVSLWKNECIYHS